MMPLYTFKCKCGNTTDILCKSTDKELRMCTKCGCGMTRQFPTTNKPKFKGSGFYETDYKKRNND